MASQDGFVYNYPKVLNISIGDFVLPDPSSWTYQIGDLDTSGSRDSTGYLHRSYVATKINYEFSWNALEWEMLDKILNAINAKPKFTLKAPDPRNFRKVHTGDYYVGDRTGEVKFFSTPTQRKEIAVFSLKLKFIEY